MPVSDATEFRDSVEQILAGLIGICTLQNGAQTPAIFLIPPPLPNNRTVSGLEIICSGLPEHDRISISSSKSSRKRSWRVYLIQHDKTGSLLPAIEALLKVYPECPSPVFIPQTESNEEQVSIVIPDFILLN